MRRRDNTTARGRGAEKRGFQKSRGETEKQDQPRQERKRESARRGGRGGGEEEDEEESGGGGAKANAPEPEARWTLAPPPPTHPRGKGGRKAHSSNVSTHKHTHTRERSSHASNNEAHTDTHTREASWRRWLTSLRVARVMFSSGRGVRRDVLLASRLETRGTARGAVSLFVWVRLRYACVEEGRD